MATPVADPETLEAAQNAVKGLTVLSAIPVALLALWGDYFDRHIESLKKDKADREIDDELRMVRMAFLTGLIFQFGLYLSTSSIRDHYPVYTNVLFVITLLAQMRLQTWLESKVIPTPKIQSSDLRPSKDPESQASPLARGMTTSTPVAKAFLFSMISGMGYLAVLLGTLRLFTWIAIATKASTFVGAAWILAGALLGILGGLFLAFALGPIQLKSMYPTAPLEEEEALERIRSCFQRASLPVPSLWIIREASEGLTSPANAMIAGVPGFRGSFGPSLFVSERLLRALEWNEIEAVISHEISHVRLRHLRRRFIYTGGLVLAGILASTAIVLIAGWLSGNGPMAVYAGTIAVFGGFIYGLKQVGEQSRMHEIEADLEAIRLGAEPEALIRALVKLDRINGVPADREGSAHPATAERIKVIRESVARAAAAATAQTPAPEQDRNEAA